MRHIHRTIRTDNLKILEYTDALWPKARLILDYGFIKKKDDG